jgi:hypothetical protein
MKKKALTLAEVTSMGGKARATKLSKERRLEISRAANEAKRLKRAGLRDSSAKEDFHRLLRRAISPPSVSRKSEPKRLGTTGA